MFHLIEIVPTVPVEILPEVQQNKQTNKNTNTQTINTKLLPEVEVTVTWSMMSENADIKISTLT